MRASIVRDSGGRIRLRELETSDFDAVHAYASDPLVTRYMSWGPNTPEDTRTFLNRTIHAAEEDPRRMFTYAIAERSSGKLIGTCGLQLLNPTGPQFMFGYCLHPAWWGQGFGKESVALLVELAFEDLRAHRLIADVFAGNVASKRLLQRLGF